MEGLLKKTLAFSPIVGLFGHRQVGKTTLVSRLGERYQTLDDRETIESANENPVQFLLDSAARPVAIDECQLAPPLFPALKEWVRTKPHPGQFLITGSVRFSSRKAIRESLTGRMIAWELLPMDLSEIHAAPLPSALVRLLSAKTVEIDLRPVGYFSEKQMDHYLETGGLPGIFGVRDPAIRAQRFETQLNALLERDLKLILQTTLSYRSLRALAVQLALLQGEPLELSSLARKIRISVPTLRKLIAAFEAMFFIRLVPSEGSEKKPVIFFEDQGEATFLSSGRNGPLVDWTRFMYSELRVQLHYRPEKKGRVFQYRNRGGALVPLCFATEKSAIGLLPILEESPPPGALATARSFLNRYPNGKVLLVHSRKTDRMINSRVRVLGLSYLIG